MHERQGQAQMQRTGALNYSCYPSAAAKPERWQRGQGHELGCSSHLCHLIWCTIQTFLSSEDLLFLKQETERFINITGKLTLLDLDLGCKR